MKKSQTGVVLPTIKSNNKFGRASINKARLRSVFVERVKQQINEDDQYQAMATSQLSEQQKKLKQLLREFNDQSHFILASFIEGEPRTARTQSLRNSAQQLQIRQKQFQNRDKLFQVCMNQLKSLESRCQNLKYMTRQEMQKQIIELNQEIQSLRISNKDLARGVTLNGLNICRGEKSNDVKQMEYEKAQLQIKKTQLQTNNEQVNKQNDSIKQKLVTVDKRLSECQNQYKQALNHENILIQSQKYKQVIKQKKKHIQSIKQRNQQYFSGLKQKYFNKLRQMDQFNTSSKKSNEELSKKQQLVQNSKRQLIILQHQLSALKQGVTTIKLLDQKKK